MTRKIKFGIIILTTLIVNAGILSLITSKNERIIEYKIKKANYCDVPSDCSYISGPCFAGCGMYVNRNEYEYVLELLRSYDGPACEYLCIPSDDVLVCQNKKCKRVP